MIYLFIFCSGGDPSSPHPAAVHVKATVIDPVSQMTCVSQLNVSVELRPDDVRHFNFTLFVQLY